MDLGAAIPPVDSHVCAAGTAFYGGGAPFISPWHYSVSYPSPLLVGGWQMAAELRSFLFQPLKVLGNRQNRSKEPLR